MFFHLLSPSYCICKTENIMANCWSENSESHRDKHKLQHTKSINVCLHNVKGRPDQILHLVSFIGCHGDIIEGLGFSMVNRLNYELVELNTYMTMVNS